MKLIKMLGLAAMAAMVAMAFVGVSSASAEKSVVLCEEPELSCENPWPHPTTIVGHAKTPKLLSSIGTVECDLSLVVLTLLNLLKELIEGHILKLSFTGNCHLGSTKCTVTVLETGGVSILHGANPLEWDGVAIPLHLLEPLSLMNTEANVKCGFFINCTYIGGEETKVTSTNNEAGEVTLVAEKAELKKSKGICPSVSEWDAKYTAVEYEELENGEIHELLNEKDEVLPMTGLWLES
jgi:hypothetical protein